MVEMMEYLKLIAVSFGCSFGLGFVFRIPARDLVWAGIGGGLTRCVYLIMLAVSDNTFLQTLVAAIFAALFAEIMAMRQRTPSTVFLYPAILPLIPGGTMYYIALNLILGEEAAAMNYFKDCVLALTGMCLGFVLISTFTYYRRIYYATEHLKSDIVEAVKIFLSIDTDDKKQ